MSSPTGIEDARETQLFGISILYLLIFLEYGDFRIPCNIAQLSFCLNSVSHVMLIIVRVQSCSGVSGSSNPFSHQDRAFKKMSVAPELWTMEKVQTDK